MKKSLLLLSLLTLSLNSVADTRHASQAALFRATTPCPATHKIQKWCAGYVVDHTMPLCAGGIDSPSNMQWQTKSASYLKDIEERKLCRSLKLKGVTK